MRKLSFVVFVAFSLGGCGAGSIAAKSSAREAYQRSTANYQACLAGRGPQACETQRLAMEADERLFNSMSAAMQ